MLEKAKTMTGLPKIPDVAKQHMAQTNFKPLPEQASDVAKKKIAKRLLRKQL
jgi:hypothetical protein